MRFIPIFEYVCHESETANYLLRLVVACLGYIIEVL